MRRFLLALALVVVTTMGVSALSTTGAPVPAPVAVESASAHPYNNWQEWSSGGYTQWYGPFCDYDARSFYWVVYRVAWYYFDEGSGYWVYSHEHDIWWKKVYDGYWCN